MLGVDGLKCWLAIRRRGLSEGRQPASPSWPTVQAPARASTCSASNTASARSRGRYPSQVNEAIFHLLGKIDERCRDEQDDASMSCRSLHLQLMAACCKSSCVADAQAPPKKDGGVSRVFTGETRLWAASMSRWPTRTIGVVGSGGAENERFLIRTRDADFRRPRPRPRPGTERRGGGPVSLWLICPTLRNYRDGALNEPLPRARNLFSTRRLKPFAPCCESRCARL